MPSAVIASPRCLPWGPILRTTASSIRAAAMGVGRPSLLGRLLVLGWLSVLGGISAAQAQVDFERPPISYQDHVAHDAVTDLQQRIEAGEVQLEYEPRFGYLRSLLEALDVPLSSQALVYSKTSLQMQRITPREPRAIYFNDDVYIGWVRRGRVLEIMATDPQLGQVFYTLSQQEPEGARGSAASEAVVPQLRRDRNLCITCHASSRTQGVPGVLVRSLFVTDSGLPRYGAGSFTIDHRSPFRERWGGWYVTGTHGEMRHMGNVFAEEEDHPERLDRDAGANVTDLSDRLDVSRYLTPHSDIVALMVMEHQSQMHNYLTRANYEARSAAHHDQVMNEALERPAGTVSESTERRIAAAGEELLRYMLMGDEFPLTDPVAGTSGFAEEFQERGPRDRQGRSLRDLDLQKRLFKYPCSYLIYSPAFDRLPASIKSYIARRLDEVLSGEDDSEPFAHLTSADRRAILEILRDTKPDLWSPPES